jgi:hypothetical protein
LLFQYKSSDRRFFYWLQDLDGEKDDENVKEVNKLINEPAGVPAAAAAAIDTGESPATTSTAVDTSVEASNASNALTADALASILNGAQTPAAGSAAAAAPSTTPAAVPIDFFAAPGATPAPGGAAATPAAPSKGLTLESLQGALGNLANQPTPVPLTEVLEPGSVIETGILEDEDVVAKLLPLLPEGQQTKESLEEVREKKIYWGGEERRGDVHRWGISCFVLTTLFAPPSPSPSPPLAEH